MSVKTTILKSSWTSSPHPGRQEDVLLLPLFEFFPTSPSRTFSCRSLPSQGLRERTPGALPSGKDHSAVVLERESCVHVALDHSPKGFLSQRPARTHSGRLLPPPQAPVVGLSTYQSTLGYLERTKVLSSGSPPPSLLQGRQRPTGRGCSFAAPSPSLCSGARPLASSLLLSVTLSPAYLRQDSTAHVQGPLLAPMTFPYEKYPGAKSHVQNTRKCKHKYQAHV